MNTLIHLHWLGVAAAVAAFFVTGSVWFPLIVRRAYVVALGREMKTGAISLLGPLACITVVTIADAILVGLIGIRSLRVATQFGALVGVGYLLPMVVNISLNPLFPRPLLYAAINAPYFVVGNALACAVLVAMG